MLSFLRMLLIATALLTSGALQVAAGLGEDGCCPEGAGQGEPEDAPCPDCPPGLACACCPIRGVVHAAALDVAPDGSSGVALVVAPAEPSLGASVTDIFHPPRA
jgi:hypothetical protein